MTEDPFQLQRFVDAQEGSYADALAELKAGRKRSHWMWFVFPQVAGLGSSHMARKYAIASQSEAEAYLKHPLLGARLVECARTLLTVNGRSALEIMGSPDDAKLRSSMTLFASIAGADPAFAAVLRKYFSSEADARTIEFLKAEERLPS